MRAWGRALAVLVTTVTVIGGATTAAAEEADRLTGGDAAHAAAEEPGAGGVAAATTIVPLPDLGITHRLSGGMNLWRMPLSEREDGHGVPALVKRLNVGGFSFDHSVTLAGDFGDLSPSDDGTADHVIWHQQPNGGVLLWAVGGGEDTTPRLWHDLRTGGWSYAHSTPLVADVTGDGWDDLVVVHRNGYYDNIWVFPSDGQRLGAPQFWRYKFHRNAPRFAMGDLDGDGVSELLTAGEVYWLGRTISIDAVTLAPGGAYTYGSEVFQPLEGGWSFPGSRQLTGDVTGDGLTDLVTVHGQYGGGMLVWVHENCSDGTSFCFQDPVVWQDLKTGGWSFAGSRQHLADTNGDGADDLVSIHYQGSNPGMLVWRHISTGTSLQAPQIVANLMTGGWSYAGSREGVAETYGVLVTP